MSQSSIVSRILEVMGPAPREGQSVSLDVRIESESRESGYLRRKISFETEPSGAPASDRCFAWVTIPLKEGTASVKPSSSRFPAVICLHQTTRIGKDEPMGLGGLPNLHYAKELASRGFVTLSPDYPNFGDYRCDAYALGYASATMKGIWNHRRAVDVLTSMPEVDPNRIGCVGHSLGGHNTLFLAAFEPRIKAAVSSCGFTLFKYNRHGGEGGPGNITDWSHAGYMPRIMERYGARAENMPFEWNDVLSLIAPRPIFINATTQDSFDVEGVRECEKLIRPIYKGRDDDFIVRSPDCGHDFPQTVREESYRFLERVLNRP